MGGSIRHAPGFSACAAATTFSDSHSSFNLPFFSNEGPSKRMVN